MDVIATNLRRLRKRQELSQGALAESAGLSRGGYQAVEQGSSMPKPETLRALAKALAVPLRELVTPSVALQQVRFRSLKRLKRREDVLVDVSRWLTDYAALEALLADHVAGKLAPLVNKAAAARPNGIAAVAAVARRHLGLDDKQPVHDICGLLASAGVKVRSLPVASDAFFGLSVAEAEGGPAIIVNTWERIPVETWIFSAAHELGHLLLHLSSYVVDEAQEVKTEEQEADAFASFFLMPDVVFQKEWSDAAGVGFYERVLKVKRIFRMSWRSVLYRLALALPAAQRRDVWQRFNLEHERRTGQKLLKHHEPDGVEVDAFALRRAAAEPAKLDPVDFIDDRQSRLVKRAVDEGKMSLARAGEVLGLSVEDMRRLAQEWA